MQGGENIQLNEFSWQNLGGYELGLPNNREGDIERTNIEHERNLRINRLLHYSDAFERRFTSQQKKLAAACLQYLMTLPGQK